MASAMNASSPSNFTACIIQDSHFSDEPFLAFSARFQPKFLSRHDLTAHKSHFPVYRNDFSAYKNDLYTPRNEVSAR
jgi:hypothetical protein